MAPADPSARLFGGAGKAVAGKNHSSTLRHGTFEGSPAGLRVNRWRNGQGGASVSIVTLSSGPIRRTECPNGACQRESPALHTNGGHPAQTWLRRALLLVGITMLYNLIEAIVALWSGGKADSIALVGFGLDSVIEMAAASVLLWRLAVEARGTDAATIERTEQRVLRFVGATFLLLALYVSAQAAWTLWRQLPPEETLVGIVLASASLVVMPLVSWGKLRAARQLGSAALRAEAKETLACSYLSLALLLGLGANAALDWWWADPIAALLMVPWLVKEGREGLRGEACCQSGNHCTPASAANSVRHGRA